MKINRLQVLVERAINSGSVQSQFDESGLRLTIRAVAEAETGVAEPDTTISLDIWRTGPSTVHSSLFGLFHLQSGSDAAPFVSLGQDVEAGQRIGLIEAMKVFSPVIAHRAGRIVAVLAEHGAEVECGQPLFHVE